MTTSTCANSSMSPPKSKLLAASPQELVPPEDRSGERPAFSSDAYNKVARSATLVALALTSSKFLVDPSFDPEKLSFGFNGSPHGHFYDSEAGAAGCHWNWSVHARRGRKKLLTIEATYLLLYEQLTECEEPAVLRYLERVGRFATYPYFRTHVSQLSWESSTNLPLLPTIAT
jgi:hypothetical protein